MVPRPLAPAPIAVLVALLGFCLSMLGWLTGSTALGLTLSVVGLVIGALVLAWSARTVIAHRRNLARHRAARHQRTATFEASAFDRAAWGALTADDRADLERLGADLSGIPAAPARPLRHDPPATPDAGGFIPHHTRMTVVDGTMRIEHPDGTVTEHSITGADKHGDDVEAAPRPRLPITYVTEFGPGARLADQHGRPLRRPE